jgi:hypothetical protein
MRTLKLYWRGSAVDVEQTGNVNDVSSKVE